MPAPSGNRGSEMAILTDYRVDRELYRSPGKPHHISLITTEYTHKNDVLIHLQIGKNLGVRLNNLIRYEFKKDDEFQNEQFMQKKTYGSGKPKATTRSTFEEKLKRFDVNKTATIRETLIEYSYTGKNGKPDALQIVVIEKDGSIHASIEFKDTEQYENFIKPAWITELIGRSL